MRSTFTQVGVVFWSKKCNLGFFSVNVIRFGKAYRARKGRFGVTFESVGHVTSGLFENYLLARHQDVAIAYMTRKGRYGVTFESVGDETSGVSEIHRHG